MIEETMKKCSKCNRYLPSLDFNLCGKGGHRRADCKYCVSKYHDTYYKSINYKYAQYKFEAKDTNRKFELSIIDFSYLISSPCAYCGKVQETFNGVDRVNSKQGYTLDNCVSCCSWCNTMKRHYDVNAFIEQVQNIHDWQTDIHD